MSEANEANPTPDPQPAPPAEQDKPAVKPWYRRIKPWQFSLRTLLVLMAIASAVCWYYLLPEQEDEKIAGGYLLLQRQFRRVQPVPAQPPPGNPAVIMNPPVGLFNFQVNDGYWRIKDLEGNPIVDGHYQKNAEHGWWTTYHPNGRIAVQGKMRSGSRSGVWQTWSPEGRLISQVHYVPTIVGFGASEVRQGPARFWHPTGKLAAAGQFDKNERTGKWEEWNEQGELISAGEYQAGKKTGAWQELSAEENKFVTRQYVQGMPKELFDAQLKQLAERIEKGDIATRLTLLSAASDYGAAALPVIERWTTNDDPQVQLTAIVATAKCGGKVDSFESALSKIVETTPHLAATARWELYSRFPNAREPHFRPLVREAHSLASNSPLAGIDLLRQMFAADPARRQLIFDEVLNLMGERTGHEVQMIGDPGELPTGEWVKTWETGVIPFLKQTLADAKPEQRLAAVRLIRQILRERQEVDDRLPVGSFPKNWKIPPMMLPLVQRARRDSDQNVQDEAEHVDEPYYGLGGFGGGGGLF